MYERAAKHNNGMQRSADTRALIFSRGAARPLMPGVRFLLELRDLPLVMSRRRAKCGL